MICRDLEDRLNPKDPQAAGADQGDDRRKERITKSAHSAGGYIHYCQEEIRESHIGQTNNAVLNGLRIVGNIQRKDRYFERVQNKADTEYQSEGTSETNEKDFLNAAIILRAGILPYVVRCGGIESAGDALHHILYVHGSAVAGDDSLGIERVDSGRGKYI